MLLKQPVEYPRQPAGLGGIRNGAGAVDGQFGVGHLIGKDGIGTGNVPGPDGAGQGDLLHFVVDVHFMASLDPKHLPDGVRYIATRHHSDPEFVLAEKT